MLKQRLFIAALLLAPLAWLFGGALVCDEMFVYRDAAHYYYPLYRLVADNWAAGRVPLWNSQENLGQPLLADATAAVLYPGKLIFASPLGYDANYKLYIVGHVLLAAILAFVAARGFGRSAYAAALAALAYAFGGSVLFQYCNVVYLVSAAWLPLAALAIDRMLRERSWRWAIALGAMLAMMTLGGDPQTAYHAGLAAVLYAFILWRCEAPSPTTVRRPHRLHLLGAAALALLVLAAVQILPSAEWTRRSTRAAWDQPRNIYEAASSLRVEDQAKIDRFGFLLGRTTPGQHEGSYEFSVAPWHLATFVWPNILGQVFPTNTRWINALPAETRTWTPSFYIGLLPLLLALSQFRLTVGRARLLPSQAAATDAARIRWLSWLTLLALLASFGWFGLGWLAREIYFAASGPGAAEPPWGSPLGGVYWLLHSLLPGYAYFRYPAKWLVFVSLGLSLLAAYGWDQVTENRSPRGLGLSFIGIAIAVLYLLVIAAFLMPTAWLLPKVPHDSLFGPLHESATFWGISWALLQPLVVVQLLSVMFARRVNESWLLIVVAMELALSQGGMIATSPAQNWHSTPAVAAAIAEDVRASGSSATTPPRVYRSLRFLPPEWARTTSTRRQIEGQQWDLDTLLPKYHLLTDLEMTASSSALRSADVVEFQHAQRRYAQRMTFEQYHIAPETRRIAGERIPLAGVAATQLVRVDGFPRAWIVHEARTLPPLAEHHGDAVWRRSNDVLALAAERGFRQVAVVETSTALALDDRGQPIEEADESCEIIAHEPHFVAIDVRVKSPAVVVLADAYEASWRCTATDLPSGISRDLPVLRTNRILRGVELPVGAYRLEFRYRPTSVYLGAIISAIGWLALAIAGSQRLATSLIAQSKKRRRDVLRPC